MKNLQFTLFIILFFAVQLKSSAQIIFTETFGQTTVRQTSPYMPTGSFRWGNPSGTTEEKAIDNNHYAIIAPANINTHYPVPYFWFWTGPGPAGNTSGSAGNPATNDHTGNTNGAVMVINAGTTVKDFYQRQVTLVPGSSYRLSVWMYLVNASSSFTIGIKDPVTNTVLGSYTTPFLNTTDTWVQYQYNFTYSASCAANSHINAFLGNTFSATNGNDYYIDDIVLQTISGPAANINCPTAILPVKLESFNATVINNNNVQISWKTSAEYDVKYFDVEKSTDGKSFNTVNQIQPSNTATGSAYQVTDNNNSATNKILYRLKTVNNNESISYSHIIPVQFKNGQNDVTVYPQPSRNGVVTVSWKTDGPHDITIYNATGRMINTWNKYHNNSLTINGLTNGCYVIRLHQNGKAINKTILVGQ